LVHAGVALLALALVVAIGRVAGIGAEPATEAGTDSPVAKRFYEEGLGNFRGGQVEVARSLMEAALREDTTFAMAAYYLAIMGEGHAWELRQRALRLAQRAPLPQRIQIQAEILRRDHDPGAVAVAREWTERVPGEGEAFVVLGATLHVAGDWAGSAAALERALSILDAQEEDRSACGLCGALDQLINVYLWWDSLPAVERVARRSLMRYPDRTWPVAALAMAAARSGDSVRALQHLGRLTAAREGATFDPLGLRILLTLEAYDQVVETGRRLLASARPGEVATARWMVAIALRNQGRMAEAQQVVSAGRVGDGPAPLVPPEPIYPLEAIIALERGNPVRAAALFEIQGTQEIVRAEGVRARWLTWQATLVGTALAAAGDTVAVRALMDTAAYWGARSLYGRDQRAHHFLRGLLLAARGLDAEAVGEYRQAIHSPSLGYTRVNLELGRALVRLGRPAEAIPVLHAALRGEVDASNLYVTRTELHEVLGDAFRQAGQPDSAAVHLRAVVRALAQADRPFVARRHAAERWLRAQVGEASIAMQHGAR
jgi:tetratricopeptide (TPR) repeat protein